MITNHHPTFKFDRNGIKIHWSSGWPTVLVSLLMGTAFILLYRLHLSIFPYSHEWEYGWLLRNTGLLDFALHHYREVNGRLPVHLLIGFLSTGDIQLWRLLNPALMVGYIVLLYRLINDSGNARFGLAAALIGLTLAIDQSAAQSGLYWLTGALNYAWPTALAVTIFTVLFFHYDDKVLLPGTPYLLPLMGLLAGWTTEQGGAIALGLSGALIIWLRFVRRKPVPFHHWVTLAAIGIGYILLISAPGNDVRIFSNVHFYSQPFLSRILIRTGEISQQLATAKAFATLNIIHLTLTTTLSWYLRKSVRGWSPLNRILPALTFTLLLSQIFVFNDLNSVQQIVDSAFSGVTSGTTCAAFIALYVSASLYAAFLAATNDRGLLFPLFFLAALGSQLMLVLAPPDAGRLFIPGIMLFIASSACLYYSVLQQTASARVIWRKILTVAVSLPLLGLGVHNYAKTVTGYDTNRTTMVANQQAISRYLNSNEANRRIVLSRLPSPNFHWEMPYQNPYFTPFYFYYYGIPRDTKLVWTGVTSDASQRAMVDLAPHLELTLATSGRELFSANGCTVYYWRHYIIFSPGNWPCSALRWFDITSELNDGSAAFYKNQTLYFDQYMIVVQNLNGDYRSYHSYHLPYVADQLNRVYVKWGDVNTTITWPTQR